MTRRTTSKYLGWGFWGALTGAVVGCSSTIDVGRTQSGATDDAGANKGTGGISDPGSGASSGGKMDVPPGTGGADSAGGASGSGGQTDVKPPNGTGGSGSSTGTPDSGDTFLCNAFPAMPLSKAVTGANGYAIAVVTSKPAAYPTVGDNEWILRIHDPNGNPVDGAALSFDEFMPAHGHHGVVVPSVSPQGTGSYDVQQVDFNMAGFWTVTVSIAVEGTKVDSAVLDLCAVSLPTEDAGAPTCDQRTAQMQNEFSPVLASADKSCATDQDCVLAPSGNRCFGVSCKTNVVSKTGGDAINAELMQIDVKECDAFFAASCLGPGAFSCPAEFPPKCDSGACVAGTP